MTAWNELLEVWDEHHPADALDALEVVDDSDSYPAVPTIDGIPEVVDYSVREPGSWVVSGPILGCEELSSGLGRVFLDEAAAYRWACWRYGADRVKPHEGGIGRWAVLISGVRDE